jgi:hypothetical protein
MIPNHLQEKHKRLIYKSSLSPIITGGEAFKINLPGGETIILEPSATHTRPGKSLYQPVLDLLKTKEDVKAVVPALLREVTLAYKYPPRAFVEKVVRRCCELDGLATIMNMLERPKTSGLRLSTPTILREVYLGLHRSVVAIPEGGNTTYELEKARRRALKVLTMLQDPNHTKSIKRGNKSGKVSTLSVPIRVENMPDVIGTMVEILALDLAQPEAVVEVQPESEVLAAEATDAFPEETKTTNSMATPKELSPPTRDEKLQTLNFFIRELQAIWPETEKAFDLESEAIKSASLADSDMPTSKENSGKNELNRARYQLTAWIPTWHGLKIAQGIIGLDAELSKWCVKAYKQVDTIISRSRKTVEKKGDGARGLIMLEELAKSDA